MVAKEHLITKPTQQHFPINLVQQLLHFNRQIQHIAPAQITVRRSPTVTFQMLGGIQQRIQLVNHLFDSESDSDTDSSSSDLDEEEVSHMRVRRSPVIRPSLHYQGVGQNLSQGVTNPVQGNSQPQQIISQELTNNLETSQAEQYTQSIVSPNV